MQVAQVLVVLGVGAVAALMAAPDKVIQQEEGAVLMVAALVVAGVVLQVMVRMVLLESSGVTEVVQLLASLTTLLKRNASSI